VGIVFLIARQALALPLSLTSERGETQCHEAADYTTLGLRSCRNQEIVWHGRAQRWPPSAATDSSSLRLFDNPRARPEPLSPADSTRCAADVGPPARSLSLVPDLNARNSHQHRVLVLELPPQPSCMAAALVCPSSSIIGPNAYM